MQGADLGAGQGLYEPVTGISASVPFMAQLDKNTLRIDMEIQIPQKEKKVKARKVRDANEKKRAVCTVLSSIFTEQKFPEPVYFQNVDCVGIPDFFSSQECRHIIDNAEAQGFCSQSRHRALHMYWTDIVDPFFAAAIWQLCGLEWFLRTITVEGLVPCGINDVIRIQKYTQGSLFGRHIDQNVRRDDGRISKYSLRVFLNSGESGDFEGGLSSFHVPFRPDAVSFDPEEGLALIYPQGDLCTVQEETEVLSGVKYVLRADILFCRPDDLLKTRTDHPSAQ